MIAFKCDSCGKTDEGFMSVEDELKQIPAFWGTVYLYDFDAHIVERKHVCEECLKYKLGLATESQEE